VTPFKLRTTLTLIYTAILTLLLTALGFAYYRVLALHLDLDATDDLKEITSGMHVEGRGAGDEIDEVIDAFNDALARLEQAVNE
jgi:hypothetical protein